MNDLVSDNHAPLRHRPLSRRLAPAPVYLGHSTATRQVQAQIHRALQSSSPVLVSGAPGTGKRTVAEILQHFGKHLGPVDYVCPIEQLPLDQQLSLVTVDRPGRVVLGTRLQLHRVDPELQLACPIHIQLPTLRQRIEDLELLAARIIWESLSRRPIGGINDYALDCLRAHTWPGNVTELEDVLRVAIEVGTTEQIELRDLPPALRLHAVSGVELESPDLEFSLAHAERSAIERAMRYARGKKRKAARLLRISKTTLYRKLRQPPSEDQEEPERSGGLNPNRRRRPR
jgi:DNA-binding NtrC family response regulator